MHSRIFQLSTRRIPEEDWINENSFDFETYGRFGIDYVSVLVDRENSLDWLKDVLPEKMFKVEGDKITILNDGSCLFEGYKNDLMEMVNKLTFVGDVQNSFLGIGAFKIEHRAKKIINTDFLFSIEDWTELDTPNDLVGYCYDTFHSDKPKILYVNGILDYHY